MGKHSNCTHTTQLDCVQFQQEEVNIYPSISDASANSSQQRQQETRREIVRIFGCRFNAWRHADDKLRAKSKPQS